MCDIFSYVFWLGDMNFRINDIPRTDVIAKVDDGTYNELLEHDQVCICICIVFQYEPV